MKLFSPLFTLAAILAIASPAHASDHDDGEMELKGRNLSLTDVFAFREASQNGKVGGKDGNIVLIMNTNPRSLPQQEYYFSTQAKYEFHITRVEKKTAIPTGKEDVVIAFKFGEPNEKGQQPFTVTIDKDGSSKTFDGKKRALTTSLADSTNDRLVINDLGSGIEVFAGLREDPFFFDVEQFFKVRAAAVKTGKLSVGFETPARARDFAKNYNVNAIAIKMGVPMLRAKGKESVFDVWATISVPGDKGGWRQIERLGRPAINEGLLLSNAKLNAFNSIPPTADLAVNNPAVLSVLQEASASLDLVDSLDGKLQFKKGFDSNVVKGFLPDVMRVDTSVVLPVEKAAYNGDFVVNDLGAAMLTGGRKIEDDVADITLSYIIAGDPTGAAIKDNVSYEGVEGNPSQGHKLLYKQKKRKGAAEFPFLATPN